MIVLVERHKCLTLVRDAKRLQPFAIYLIYGLSNRLSRRNPPGFSGLLMPRRLGSQQRKRTMAAGNRSAATIPYDRLRCGGTAIQTRNQRGRVFHHLSWYLLCQGPYTKLLLRTTTRQTVKRSGDERDIAHCDRRHQNVS